MTTVQKFKLLTTKSGLTRSPIRSPRTCPVVNFCIPKTTLGLLLIRASCRKSSTSQETSHPKSFVGNLPEKKKADKDLSGRTLKDLFVSSSLLEEDDDDDDQVVEENGEKSEVVLARQFNGVNGLGREPGSPRPGFTEAGLDRIQTKDATEESLASYANDHS